MGIRRINHALPSSSISILAFNFLPKSYVFVKFRLDLLSIRLIDQPENINKGFRRDTNVTRPWIIVGYILLNLKRRSPQLLEISVVSRRLKLVGIDHERFVEKPREGGVNDNESDRIGSSYRIVGIGRRCYSWHLNRGESNWR